MSDLPPGVAELICRALAAQLEAETKLLEARRKMLEVRSALLAVRDALGINCPNE